MTEKIIRKVIPFALIFFIGIQIIPVNAQTLEASKYQWQNVVIGGGGYVTGIHFSEAQKNLIYARTDVGGAYRWDSISNSWTQLLNFIGEGETFLRDVESISTDPTDSQRLYIASGESSFTRILRSTDQGRTFTKLTPPFTVSGNGGGRSKGERLMVDPNKTNILFYGTRSQGLYRSINYGTSWKKITGFPVTTTTDGVGICFLILDKSSSSFGDSTSVIYAGVSQKTSNLYKSIDGGTTWQVITGTPAGYQPHNAGLDTTGMLYISYCDAAGPNGITGGVVCKYNTKTAIWTRITPPTGQGGFGGLSVDINKPGTVMVSTIDRWWPNDEVYRTINGGLSWKAVDANSVRDASDAPYLYNGNKSAKLKAGNWIDNLNIDPFNSNRVMYGTGSGIWACSDVTNCENNTTTHWTFLVKGVEEMGPYEIISPPSGAPLLSVVGDCGGFRHTDLTVSPQNGFFTPPGWGTNTGIDFAQNDPNKVVRTYFGSKLGAWSINNGVSWTEFSTAPKNAGKNGDKIAISANGDILIWATDTMPSYSVNNGSIWTYCSGIPKEYWYSIISDRVNNAKFYVYHNQSGYVYVSTDGGAHFAKGGYIQSWGGKIAACPTVEGDVWMPVWDGLYHSSNSGMNFSKLSNIQVANSISFGKAAPGKTYPTLFLFGKVNNLIGFYSSVDAGKTWLKINDSQHQYGYDAALVGDQSTFGRVYVGTHCMGIAYGQIQDCNGDWGGQAFIDSCGTCVGGNTGFTGCTDTEVATVINDPEIICYPNPFDKSTQLRTNEVSSYQVQTINGTTIDSGICDRECSIGGDFVPGVYILSVSGKNETSTIKILKK